MRHYVAVLALWASLGTLGAQDYRAMAYKSQDGRYSYERVSNDPTNTRIYTLSNGLKVYLSRDTSSPRIDTYIAVRTGSSNDPQDNTGLAHYLEHMLFKGTSKMGSVDWQKERVELEKITDLYERHKATSDTLERKRLYRQIDSISQVAASYVSANEFDRLTTAIGAQGTNAHTSNEETVYKVNIPSNELERWLKIESERFGELVLRLFHTEIEAVYEEFNQGQDKIFWRVYKELGEALFPTHPFGQQTTIGTSEHLKTPSLKAIHRYFDKYYVPNNMAVVLVGDFDYDETIRLVDKYLGAERLPAKPLERPQFAREAPITEKRVRELSSPDMEFIFMGYRLEGGAGSRDALLATIVGHMLSNGKAGLMDLNLAQKQALGDVGMFLSGYSSYTTHLIYGMPKEGQTLEEVEALITGEIERIKRGDFPDWLISASINDLELHQLKDRLDPSKVGAELYESFIYEQPWDAHLARIRDMRKVSKQEIIDFVRRNYTGNYAIVYKRQGESKDLVRVQNPGITPLEIDRERFSTFAQGLMKESPERIQPKFVDYKQAIKRVKVGGFDVEYVLNQDNDLFSLYYIFDTGNTSDKRLSFALSLLDYLGTERLSAEELQQELFKLGLTFSIKQTEDRVTVSLSGLKRSLREGIQLVEELFSSARPDAEALEALRQATFKNRRDAKTSKDQIFQASVSYATYGEDAPERDILSREELEALTAEELVGLIRGLFGYKHRVFYYGNDVKTLGNVLSMVHKQGKQAPIPPKVYQRLATGGKVYYADHDMVQAQMMMIRKAGAFDPKAEARRRLFNAYFGGGMGSIVFQEIREAKSLAYAAYAYMGGARKTGDPNYVRGFIGTQSNKLPEAFGAMRQLVMVMPESQQSFETAKESVIRDIESERIIRDDVFWRYESLKKLGITHDMRREVYEEIQKLTLQDVVDFFNREIKGDNYSYVLIGRESDLPMELLRSLGQVEKLDLDHLFNNKE